MKYGFGRTAVQMACTLLALCFGIGLLRQDRMQTVFSEESVTLPIIMYHSILKDSARQGKYVVSPEVLASDLDALRERGYETVTVEDLVAYTQSGAPLPKKPVMLTFDDGYYNNYVYACPLLRQRGMRAVVSIIGSQTALFTENGEENAYWSHLRAERLRETEDVFYTYPFGACSDESENILCEMGFLCTLGCEEHRNTITRDPASLYRLGRFNRAAFESTEDFLRRALGE